MPEEAPVTSAYVSASRFTTRITVQEKGSIPAINSYLDQGGAEW